MEVGQGVGEPESAPADVIVREDSEVILAPQDRSGDELDQGERHPDHAGPTSATGVATGTELPCRAATTRYSRPTSWADGVSMPNGGRRSTQVETPSVSR